MILPPREHLEDVFVRLLEPVQPAHAREGYWRWLASLPRPAAEQAALALNRVPAEAREAAMALATVLVFAVIDEKD